MSTWPLILSFVFVSTASGALVVGGVRDIYMYVYIPGDRFECSMDQSVAVCGILW